MSTKIRKSMFLGSRAWPVRRAGILTAICVSIQCGILNISQLYRLARSVTGTASPFYFVLNYVARLSDACPTSCIQNLGNRSSAKQAIWLLFHLPENKLRFPGGPTGSLVSALINPTSPFPVTRVRLSFRSVPSRAVPHAKRQRRA
jgi:hypothetical protein